MRSLQLATSHVEAREMRSRRTGQIVLPKEGKEDLFRRMDGMLDGYLTKSDKTPGIVCTLGPECSSRDMINRMIRAGMTIARLNMSHGTHQGHRQIADFIREEAYKLGIQIKILFDLQGPKIRLGNLPSVGIEIKAGEEIVFSTDRNAVSPIIQVDYEAMHKEAKVGHPILIDDGTIEALVTNVIGNEVYAKVITGGRLKSHKGFNLPNSNVKAPSLSEKDLADVEFAIRESADMIALSFVREAADVEGLRRLLEGRSNALIVSKIETPEGIVNFDDILKLSHWIMVARGDLGCEIGLEKVPKAQSFMAQKCNEVGIPFIVATQMMESMINSSNPFRAEVADVAHAIWRDRADAVMLSGETASGKHPERVVQKMAKIVREYSKSKIGLLGA